MTQDLLQLQEQLYQLQAKAVAENDYLKLDEEIINFHRIYFSKSKDLYDIYFYGLSIDEGSINKRTEEDGEDFEYYGEAFSCLQELLIKHADKIGSLHLDSSDEGANGTTDWEFYTLLESDVTFPNLHTFKVKLYEAGHHNISTIGFYGEKPKVITQLLAKMPNIVELQLPGIPDASFFDLSLEKLQYVRLQGGTNHFNFIKLLAESNMPNFHLDYTDVMYDEADSEGTAYKRTPLEHYKLLIKNRMLNNKHFILRSRFLTQGELFELQNINPKMQLLFVPIENDYYVSHKQRDLKQ